MLYMKKTRAQRLGITKFPYSEFDDKGNITYKECHDGFSFKKKYGSNRNYIEWSDGYKAYTIIR